MIIEERPYGGRKMPTYKGCEILEFDPEYKLAHILDSKYELKEKNDGRAIDVNESDIASWGKIHRDELYDDYYNEAPCVETNDVEGDSLSMGYCKTKGKLLITPPNEMPTVTLGVWKVRWVKTDGKDADYWRAMAQLTENMKNEDKPGYHKTDRKEEDIATQFYSLYKSGHIKVTDENGQKSWKDFNKAKKDSFVSESEENLVNSLFWDKVDKKQKVDFVDAKTINHDKTSYENIMKLIKSLINDKNKYILKIHENGDLDAYPLGKGSIGPKYAYELYRAALQQYRKGIKNPIMVCKINGTKVTPEAIEKARKTHRNFFTNADESYKKDAKLWGVSEKDLKGFEPTIVFIQQCNGEKEEFYATKELF